MWTKSSSNERPEEVQKVAYDRYLIHRNITEVTETDTQGNDVTRYEYEERLCNAMEYNIIQAINDKEQKREATIIDEYTEQLIAEGVI